jgi:hypothetical protein
MPNEVSGFRYRYEAVFVRCGAGEYPDPAGIHSEEFRCNDCGVSWGRDDVSGAYCPDTVWCPNCYSDDVTVTRIRILEATVVEEAHNAAF